MKNMRRFLVSLNLAAMVISLVILAYGLHIEPVTEERITGPVRFQQNWQCTRMLAPKINAAYSLVLFPEIDDTRSNSEDGVSAAISYSVTEIPGNRKQCKTIIVKPQRYEGTLVAAGDDPFYFDTRKGYNYRVVIHVDRANFHSSDVNPSYYISMNYMDVAHHNFIRYGVLLIGGIFFLLATVLAIIAAKRSFTAIS